MRMGKIRSRSFGFIALAAPLACGALCILSSGVASAQEAAAKSPAPALAPAPLLTVEQQRVRILIQQVDEAYARGEASYHKGDLPQAKQEFDRAVDLMLASGIDIKSDQELQDEFDRIVDGVNALEMEALKLGNGFVPKEEEAPADVAEDVTFEVDPNIVAKAKADLATTNSDLPLVVNDYCGRSDQLFRQHEEGPQHAVAFL